MRLFLAVNLPKKERERIDRAARPLREQELPVRWVGIESFHVTMKFLGEVRGERLEDIQAVLDRVAAEIQPFEATVNGFGAFPTIRNPSVIWAGVEATPELRCLKQDLEWALSDLGFEKETRAFHPHLTLGRSQDRKGAGAFRGLDDVMADLSVESRFTVRTVDLMRSQRLRDGARYTVLHKARLVGEG